MSRIFDALRKAGGEAADLTMPWIAEQPVIPAEPDAGPPPAAPAMPALAASGDSRAASAGLGLEIRTARVRLPAGAPLLPFDGAHLRAAEQYRIIRTKVLQHPAQPRVLVVSSAMAGDGKTVSAVNLAGALALKDDVNVLLVDGDFRRSTIADLLGIEEAPGLAEVLSGACPLHQAIVRIEQFPNLYVLPGGKAGPNATELLDSPAWRATSAVFRKQFKFTILDSPPIAAVADFDLLQASADSVIVVIRPDHTDRTLCYKAIQTISPTKLLGVVLNCSERWFLWKTHDYYYYSNETQERCIQT